MRYSDFLSFMEGRSKVRKEWDLDAERRLLRSLGNPERRLRTIVVGGTNGKGSTTAMTASVLAEAGYKTGSYFSPHMDDYRERIRINGRPISRERLVRLFELLRPHIAPEDSFFEITTAIALKYFADEKVDFAVLEVGMGGRLDATNVTEPEVVVITNVELEHIQMLGDTVEKIAREKVGIMRRGAVLVTSDTKPEVLRVFQKACRKMGGRLVRVGKDVVVRSVATDSSRNEFEIRAGKTYRVRLSLLGKHQGTNAAMAIAAVEHLGVRIPESAIVLGLRKATIAGRLEVMRRKPLVVMDAAHNPAAMKTLARALRLFKHERLILVMGMMADKDVAGTLKEIMPHVDMAIFNRPRVPRAADPRELAEMAKGYSARVEIIEDVKESVRKALALADSHDMVLVTGSIYMLSEARGRNRLLVAQ